MAGNENKTLEFLVANLGRITLNHLGLISSILTPTKFGLADLYTLADVAENKTQDSRKKADVIINGYGVSMKQEGPCFPYNRLQRAELPSLFQFLGFENPQELLNRFDSEVDAYNAGSLPGGRSREPLEFLSEEEFYKITRFLMMDGSPNVGISPYKADFIMESPKNGINENNIKVFTFDEYYNTYRDLLKIAIRRSWYGQESEDEHTRAVSLMRKPDNLRWVYSEFTGEPRPHIKTGKQWRDEVPANERKAAYYIMIEKK